VSNAGPFDCNLKSEITMDYLHSEYDIGPSNTVIVTLDRQANVMLLDPINYQNYRSGRGYRYHGGLQSNLRCASRRRRTAIGIW
jgi:Domain of unknown function (DUF1883)